MRLTKTKKQEFDYLKTIKKINKMNGSPHYLSKDGLLTNKNQLSNIFSKEPLFNESIPIKVRMIKAAHLNPNINFSKIHKINKSAKNLKKEIINNESKSKISNLMKKNKNKIKTDYLDIKLNTKKIDKINKNNTEEISEINTLSPNNTQYNSQGEINELKKFLISPKLINKEKINVNSLKKNNIKVHKVNTVSMSEKDENNNIDNYNINTYTKYDSKIDPKQKNLYLTNFTYNKPLKGNLLGNNYLKLNKKENFTKIILNTEVGRVGNNSSNNVLSNNDFSNSNINNSNVLKLSNSLKNFDDLPHNNKKVVNKIKVGKKNKSKCYNLKTFIENNILPKNVITKKKNNSPINIKNFNNNNSYNITNNNYKYIYLSPKKEIVYTKINDDNIEIKLDELILFEERLNDINIALNTKNIYDGGASNECIEFISFYFHSSLKNIFPYFFNGMNKVIIKSSINLELFSIIITYHLSMNPTLLKELINELKKIFSLSKKNLYLYIKKIQLFYGEKYIKQNEIYFKTFNCILMKNGFFNLNENQIVQIINGNCYEIVNNLNDILNFYKSVDNNYYLDFFELFASISKIEELEIKNYFYNHLYSNSSNNPKKPKYNSLKKKPNLNINIIESISKDLKDINILNNIANFNNINTINTINNSNNIRKKSRSKSKKKEQDIKVLLEYQKNKISAPFIKNPNEKTYTIVLDLEETLVNIDKNGNCYLRPGLLSFLNDIKPYYEIISFTNESKYYSDTIIKQIEDKNKFFDYNLYREHLTLKDKEFFKDITKIGRDIKKIIIVDNISNNFKLTPENGIKISSYFKDTSENDNALFELKKLLIMFYKEGYEDLRIAIKKYSEDIKKNISQQIDDE